MNGGTAVTDSTPADRKPPEMPGLISESDGVVFLLCVADKHKLAAIHPGSVLKIQDRRCKVTFVFDLNAILQPKRSDQAA